MRTKFLMLLISSVSCGNLLHAQYDRNYQNPPLSEAIFTPPDPSNINAKFTFKLHKGNQVLFEMHDLKQLNYVPNLDSLFAIVINALIPLKDSFKADGYARRIDYLAYEKAAPKIRILAHTERPPSFTYVNKELVQLKIDTDTLRINFNTLTGKLVWWRVNGTKRKLENAPFSISVILNGLSDIDELPDAMLSQCLTRVKEETAMYLENSQKVRSGSYFKATFNMAEGSMVSSHSKRIIQPLERKEIIPTIHFGFQYARGSFMPSAAAGMQYVFTDRIFKSSTNFLRLLWEPHFSFKRDSDEKLQTFRNDFITLQLTSIDEKRNFSRLETTGNISLGYLVGKRGNDFNKNTFKMGLPGFSYGSLLFEPNFFFNNFFKDFSPSLRLVLLFE